ARRIGRGSVRPHPGSALAGRRGGEGGTTPSRVYGGVRAAVPSHGAASTPRGGRDDLGRIGQHHGSDHLRDRRAVPAVPPVWRTQRAGPRLLLPLRELRASLLVGKTRVRQ